MIEESEIYDQFMQMVHYSIKWGSLPWFTEVIERGPWHYGRALNPLAAILKLAFEQIDWSDVVGEPEMEERKKFWRDYEVEVGA